MQHAFDQSEQVPVWWRSLGMGEVVLIVLCLPAILGALWVGCLHYNTGQTVAALRWSLLPREPRPSPPVFLAGSVAGALCWVGFAALGGSTYFLELLTATRVWLIILLPEIVWLAGLGPVLALLSLRRIVLAVAGHPESGKVGYDPANAASARQHAFQ